jgi:putative ATPase
MACSRPNPVINARICPLPPSPPDRALWGPPGCGKTTLARIIACQSKCHFETISAVVNGVKELREIFEAAKSRQRKDIRTVLMVDEIHRFNRAQQDVFLPHIEDGTIVLIGATTENPSFELNAALLSRCKVLVLERLSEDALEKLIQRAEQHHHTQIPLTTEARQKLIHMADGDGRFLLNACEELIASDDTQPLDITALKKRFQKRSPLYDKHQDAHYNLISALHKSLRGSDVDAALYWLSRMLDGGEHPLYVIRRLVRFAVEDIGLADPQALKQALAAKEAFDFLGSPEGDLAIAQATIYLAMAPKSNAAYTAFKAAQKEAKSSGSLSPPMHILNAPTSLMKDLGYGKNYHYDHDTTHGFSGQNYFPETLEPKRYYYPVARGFEREMIKRLEYWNKLRQAIPSKSD